MKKLNPIVLLCALFLSLSTFTFAQKEGPRPQNKEKKEKIEALKKEFIETELNLTEAEKKNFWPTYDKMEAEIRSERKKERDLSKNLKENFETMSDAEVKKTTDDIFQCQTREIQIKKDYNTKFASQIGQKRATKLLSLERRFKQELLKRMRSEHPEGQRERRE